MLVENVLARVELVRNDAPRDAVVPILGHPRLAGVVGRPSGRTPAHVPERRELTRVRILVVRALLADETRPSPSVERLPDSPGRDPTRVGCHERVPAVVVDGVRPRTVDVVL